MQTDGNGNATSWRVWQIATVMALRPDDVHLWRVNVPEVILHCPVLWNVLSEHESVRASRFRRAKDRDQFVASRGVLRLLLAKYVGIAPAAIVFEFGKNGKPDLAKVSRKNPLCFNLSHSEDWTVYAITQGKPVGVDVEYMASNIDHESLVSTVFSKPEQQLYEMLPLQERRSVFLKLWTCKEAYIKAIGTGLALSPNEIEIDVFSVKAPVLVRTPMEMDSRQWSINVFQVADDYTGALVVEGSKHLLSYREWRFHEYWT